MGENEFYGTNMGRLIIKDQCIRSTKTYSLKQTDACTKHRASQPPTHTSKDISVIHDDEMDFTIKDVDLYNITEELSPQLLSHYLESVNESMEDLYSINVRDDTQLSTFPVEFETIKDEEPTQDVQINFGIESKGLSHHMIDTAALFEDIQSLRDDSFNQENNILRSSITEKKKRQEYLKHIIKSSVEPKNDYENKQSNSGNIQWVTADSLLEKINDLLIESTHSNKFSVKEGKSSSESFKTCSQFMETEKDAACMTTNDVKPSTWISFASNIEEIIKVTDIKHEIIKDTSKLKFLPPNDVKISNKPSTQTAFDPEKEEISSKFADITQEAAKDTSYHQLEEEKFFIYSGSYDIVEKISPHIMDNGENEIPSLSDLSYLKEDNGIESLPNIKVEPESLSDSLESINELSDDEITNYFNPNQLKNKQKRKDTHLQLLRCSLNKFTREKESTNENLESVQNKMKQKKENNCFRTKTYKGNRNLPIIIKCEKSGQNNT